MKKIIKFLLIACILVTFELFLEGSGIGIKDRWIKLKKWAEIE